MTPIELVQEEARKVNVHLPADVADHILWEYTGFPSFYPRDLLPPRPVTEPPDPKEAEEALRIQVRNHLQANLYHLQAHFPPPTEPHTGPTNYDRLRENPFKE